MRHLHGLGRVAWVLGVIGAPLAPALAAGQPPAGTASVVRVDMLERDNGSQVMEVSPAEIRAGEASFVVRNDSTELVHELLVVRTALAPGQFPINGQGTRVDESKLEDIHELEDLEPGQSGRLTLRLEPGRYVLFCNQPGHFLAGMRAELTVLR
jgi:uncharacterized cupredoxin-like copper-binding protein